MCLFPSANVVDMRDWLAYNMGIGGRDFSLLKKQQSRRFMWSDQEPAATAGTLICPTPVQLPSPMHTSLGWFVSNTFVDPQATILTKNGGVTGFTSWMGFQSWVETGNPSEIGAFAITNNGGEAADKVGRDVMNVLLN